MYDPRAVEGRGLVVGSFGARGRPQLRFIRMERRYLPLFRAGMGTEEVSSSRGLIVGAGVRFGGFMYDPRAGELPVGRGLGDGSFGARERPHLRFLRMERRYLPLFRVGMGTKWAVG